MLKKFRNTLIALAGIGILLSPALVPAVALAQTTTNPILSNGLCSGTNLDITGGSTGNGCNNTDNSGFQNILTNVVNIFSAVVGVIAVVMIIVGGLKYITSGGDSNNISGAKNTIVYALIGIIVVALAQIIVHFVLSRFTGSS